MIVIHKLFYIFFIMDIIHKLDRCICPLGSGVNTVDVAKTEFIHAVESPSLGVVASQPELWITAVQKP